MSGWRVNILLLNRDFVIIKYVPAGGNTLLYLLDAFWAFSLYYVRFAKNPLEVFKEKASKGKLFSKTLPSENDRKKPFGAKTKTSPREGWMRFFVQSFRRC